MNLWTVHVENFGKIKEAEVQPAPLTLFIGDNNSGKSYLMTLIYGLYTVNFRSGGYRFTKDTQAYQACCQLVQRIASSCVWNADTNYLLQGEELKLFQNLLNEMLEQNKNVFIKQLFNKDMEVGKLWIEFPETACFTFACFFDESGQMGQLRPVFHIYAPSGESLAVVQDNGAVWDEDQQYLLIAFILRNLLHWYDGKTGYPGETVYFPTARTGFLLTYKELMRNAVQDKFSAGATDKNLLSKPGTDFLMKLGSMTAIQPEARFQKIIALLERRVLAGRIYLSNLPVQDIVYQPDGVSQALPMYVASAVVTEVTPLLLFLKYSRLGAVLMEEPEISLHPQLQWEMARVLVQIVNRDVPVFVATHSDIMLQHINNMIKAGSMRQIEDFLQKTGYDKDDLLPAGQVAVYEFEQQPDGMTRLLKLPCGDYGFEAMTFYDTLKKLNDQIDLIEYQEEP